MAEKAKPTSPSDLRMQCDEKRLVIRHNTEAGTVEGWRGEGDVFETDRNFAKSATVTRWRIGSITVDGESVAGAAARLLVHPFCLRSETGKGDRVN